MKKKNIIWDDVDVFSCGSIENTKNTYFRHNDAFALFKFEGYYVINYVFFGPFLNNEDYEKLIGNKKFLKRETAKRYCEKNLMNIFYKMFFES